MRSSAFVSPLKIYWLRFAKKQEREKTLGTSSSHVTVDGKRTLVSLQDVHPEDRKRAGEYISSHDIVYKSLVS
jgi:hypothetical protein